MRPILARFHEPTYALMRIVLGFLFACYGSQKLFGFPAAGPPDLPTLIIVGAAIELVGGVMIAAR